MTGKIDLDSALDLVAQVSEDLKNATCDNLNNRTIDFLAGLPIDFLNDVIEEAEEQANWEFSNNPLNPGARLACEKIGAGIRVIRDRYVVQLKSAILRNKFP